MDPENELYVRVFMLCEGAKQTKRRLDILGIMDTWEQDQGVPITGDVIVMIVIERNGDAERHLMDLEWVNPDGTVRRVTTALPLPEGSGPFPLRLKVDFNAWAPGLYRLRLLIDGTTAAFSPLEIREVRPILN
mgnify:CR=1 FL=1